LLAFVLVFLIGLTCGVGLDRYGLTPVSLPKTEASALRQRLIGIWVAENGSKTEFKTDGTFDDTFRETVPDIKPGEVIDDPTKLKLVERDGRITGQYQWVEEDKIEVKVHGRPARRLRVVVEGDALTILEEDGKVLRLKRSK